MEDKSMLAWLRDNIADAADYFDRQWQRLSDSRGWRQARQIAAYRGYANHQTVWVHGRLLANRSGKLPIGDPTWWDNLRASVKRLGSKEVPGALITLRYGGQSQQLSTDGEGYYTARFTRETSGSQCVSVSTKTQDGEVLGSHEIDYLATEARLMLISDIDDTVIHTGISDLLQAARLTFLRNSKSRKPLSGAAALYRELAQTGGMVGPKSDRNPVFYLSNSPWNLYDLLDDFLDLNEFPKGALLLRDVGVRASPIKHKPHTLVQLMERFSNLKAVLVGDSGERDALYYANLAKDYPDRIHAIYIRDVDLSNNSARDKSVDDLSQTSRSLGIPFLRVQTSVDIANSLSSLKILDEAALQRVTQETVMDQAR